MITTEDSLTTITCDKCGHNQSAPESNYNNEFWSMGWVLNNGRKYIHLCRQCLTPKQIKAQNFVKHNFPINSKPKNHMKKVTIEVSYQYEIEVDENNHIVKEYKDDDELVSDLASYKFQVLPVINNGVVVKDSTMLDYSFKIVE